MIAEAVKRRQLKCIVLNLSASRNLKLWVEDECEDGQDQHSGENFIRRYLGIMHARLAHINYNSSGTYRNKSIRDNNYCIQDNLFNIIPIFIYIFDRL